MSDSQEEAPQMFPAVKVGWDDEKKGVVIHFDKDTFKTWDFIVMVLGAGLKIAEFNLNMARAAEHQRQQIMAQQQAVMKKRLGL